MIFFSSKLVKHKLRFIKLVDCPPALISITARWAEDEWGYIRKKGIEYREGVMRALSEHIVIGLYANQPVAMFALLEHPMLPKTCELMYVYVDKGYRGLGFGRQVVDEAKQIAKSSGADLMVLDTLKSGLNRMYEKFGAKIVCEGRLYSQPTDVLAIKI